LCKIFECFHAVLKIYVEIGRGSLYVLCMKLSQSALDARRKGARIAGERQHKKAVDAYMACPNYCNHCGDLIPLRKGVKVAVTRAKRFCSRFCSAQPKRVVRRSEVRCATCPTIILLKKQKSGVYSPRKYCGVCLPKARDSALLNRAVLHPKLTKSDVTSGTIRVQARSLFRKSGKSKTCFCNYSLFTEVCHIKPVSSFPPEALLTEINALFNLVSLCANHHKELDHGLLTLST